MVLFILQKFGHAKPEKECYEILFNKYSLVPEECLFIDDSLANIQVAESLKIKSIHFTNFDKLKEDIKNYIE